jgi:hypothetical protein
VQVSGIPAAVQNARAFAAEAVELLKSRVQLAKEVA